MPLQFRLPLRASLIAITWYTAWVVVCSESSLNLSAGNTFLYFSWLFLCVSGCIVLCIRNGMHRYMAMIAGFLGAVGCFFEGIVHLSGFALGPAIFLTFLVGTQGAIVGVIVLGLVRLGRERAKKRPKKRPEDGSERF